MDVTLPNGAEVTGVPDDITPEELRNLAISAGLATEDDFAASPVAASAETTQEAAQASAPDFNQTFSEMTAKQPAEDTEMGFMDWLRENAKLGSTEGVAGTSALAQASVFDPAYNLTDGAIDLGRASETADMGFMESLSTTFEENQATAQMLLQDLGLYDEPKFTDAELRAADPSGGVLTAGVRAVADPMSLIGGLPVRAAGLASRAVSEFLSGAGADLGGRTLGEIDPALGLVGSVVGGAATPTVTQSAVSKTGSFLTSKASNILKKLDERKAEKGLSPAELEMTYAGRTARNLLKLAAKEEGLANIEQLAKDFEAIKDVVGVEQFPLFVELADNATLRAKFNEVARRNPELRAKVSQEMERLVEAIENKSDQLFGGRNLSIVGAEVNEELIKNAAKAQQTLDSIDTKLVEVGTRIVKDSGQSTGNTIRNLIEAKSNAVRDSLGPEYQKVINDATKAGAVLPADGTEAIHKFVVSNRVRDIFGRTSEVDKKVMAYLQPKEVTRVVNGKEVVEKVYKPLSFENVDSLKREINRLQRKVKDDTMQMKLSQLEEVVDMQRQKIPGDFNARLQEIDKLYYERMGIPFNNNTIKDLNAKKYAEQVAPLLISTPSAARQFISSVGPEALPVIKTTIMSKLYDAAVDPKGRIRQAALDANIKKYAEVIDLVPGLRDELVDISATNKSMLTAHKAATDQVFEAEQAVKAGKILADNPNLEVTYKNVAANLGNPKEYQRFVAQLKLLDPASREVMTNRMRREVIAQAVVKEGGALKYLTDPNNTAVLTSIMGNQYVDDLKAMARLSDALRKTDVNKINVFPSKEETDEFKNITNIPLTTFGSVMRDRIASVTQKVTILASKANSTRMENATDRKMMELFLDPEGLKKLAKIAREAEREGFNAPDMGKHLNDMRRLMSERVVGFTVSSIAREQARQMAADREREQNPPEPIVLENLGFGN